MDCFHPYCPRGGGLPDWAAVMVHPDVRMPAAARAAIGAALAQCGSLSSPTSVSVPVPAGAREGMDRLMAACPCLYSQVTEKVSARGVVHLCEVTLGARIDAFNVEQAFAIQHPNTTAFTYPPLVPGAKGGDVMEVLCSEVLTSGGLPHMKPAVGNDWQWTSKSHAVLNSGSFMDLKLYGDILIPAAPHNILVSVKSVKAKERFVVSGNRLESVGFGFFNDPSEFWTPNRISMLKRWGFAAVYMPAATLAGIVAKHALPANARARANAVNSNGNPLYRPLQQFAAEMYAVAGRSTLTL